MLMCIGVASGYIIRGNALLLVVFRHSKRCCLSFPVTFSGVTIKSKENSIYMFYKYKKKQEIIKKKYTMLQVKQRVITLRITHWV